MQPNEKSRAASFLLVMSWVYLLLSIGMIAFALYGLTNPDVKLTFSGVMDAVFLIIGGALGILAGIFGLVSKILRRCRILGLILLAIAAVPLLINLLAGESFQTYWKNIAVMVLPFLYLIAALVKRSEKKPAQTQQAAAELAQPTTQYYAPAAKPPVAPEPETVSKPEPAQPEESVPPAEQSDESGK
ncbi:MAG: hypothetical protein R2912_13305 [Eubacteriales bacterium]